MKNKIIILALATTALLSGCGGANRDYHHHHRGSGAQYGETVDGVNGKNLSAEDVRKVQRSLAKQGYYDGKIDGIWGSETSQAILAYQLTNQESQTGTLTSDNLHEFGIRMDRDAYRARNN